MVQAFIAVLALLILTGMSLRANKQLSDHERLPMQWSVSRSVNWTAPRAIALSFTPALATLVLSAVTIGTIVSVPRPGQEGFEIPVVTMTSISFIAAHALHLWLVGKTGKPNGR